MRTPTLLLLVLPPIILALAGSVHSRTSDPPRNAASPTDEVRVEVYSCLVEAYRPWLSRQPRPADYQEYEYAAHVEIFLPELGVTYLPSTESFITADPERYADPLVEFEGPEHLWSERRTTAFEQIPELTLTEKGHQSIILKHREYLKTMSSQPATEGDG